jgi:hypothetical protein
MLERQVERRNHGSSWDRCTTHLESVTSAREVKVPNILWLSASKNRDRAWVYGLVYGEPTGGCGDHYIKGYYFQ